MGKAQRIDQTGIANSFSDAIGEMEGAGWYRILSVLEDDEQVYLYAREGNGRIVGLTVLVNDGGEEVVLVNIVGDIDPVVLGKALSDLDQLKDYEHLLGGGQ